MINQHYIDGYVSALNNLRSLVEFRLTGVTEDFNNGAITLDEYNIKTICLNETIKSIESVKNNYKDLIKNLNEKMK